MTTVFALPGKAVKQGFASFHMNAAIIVTYEKVRYCRGTARRAVSVELTLPTAAQLYEKSSLKRLVIGA